VNNRLQNAHSQDNMKKGFDSGEEMYRMHPTATVMCF